MKEAGLKCPQDLLLVAQQGGISCLCRELPYQDTYFYRAHVLPAAAPRGSCPSVAPVLGAGGGHRHRASTEPQPRWAAVGCAPACRGGHAVGVLTGSLGAHSRGEAWAGSRAVAWSLGAVDAMASSGTGCLVKHITTCHQSQ